jgi:hypothetical protein
VLAGAVEALFWLKLRLAASWQAKLFLSGDSSAASCWLSQPLVLLLLQTTRGGGGYGASFDPTVRNLEIKEAKVDGYRYAVKGETEACNRAQPCKARAVQQAHGEQPR